ncbi:cytochrome P450 [Nocardioides sp. SYSU D00038]|uniref:cytochrome P450 n=1 Tax=Nocardioides sp. SYSU D00038 TaxID=2812554 RepID=UPI001966F277|nr:cytochrome P450 [Nocardioides sp. SYSU D00038]
MRGLPELDVDPFDAATSTDPGEMYDRLLADPVCWLSRYGVVGISSYDLAKEVLSNPLAFRSSNGVGLSNIDDVRRWRQPSLLIESDPPDHRRARAVVNRVLSRDRVSRLKTAIESRAASAIDVMRSHESIEAMDTVIFPFVAENLRSSLGLRHLEMHDLKTWGRLVFDGFGPAETAKGLPVRQMDAVRDSVAKATDPGNLLADGLAMQIFEAGSEVGYSTVESGLLVRAFVSGGYLTVAAAIGSAIQGLAGDGRQLDELRRRPELALAALDEAIRVETPIRVFFRTTAGGQILGGRAIPSGTKVAVFLGAANRDPLRWDRPATFDIARRYRRSLSFGHGVHGCVGQYFARLQGLTLIGALARAQVSWSPSGRPTYLRNNSLRCLERLPLSISVAQRSGH